MGVYEDRVLPRIIDITIGRAFDPVRARVAAGLSGDVLEIGFGSGRNVAHYPDAVRRVLAVEPSPGARRLAEPRIAAGSTPVEMIGLDGQDLALDDQAVDHVLVTWTLCSIPDVDRALAEIHRVLRPGGRLHFVEHGRSPDPRIARRQRRLGPVWRRAFGGCHLDRPIPELIARAGLVPQVETYELRPRFVGYTYEGTAAKQV
ncbi:MAG: class I SAM-dependent methyltransferase [Acidimicrobiales bacterium]